jgi:hypothetical protein
MKKVKKWTKEHGKSMRVRRRYLDMGLKAMSYRLKRDHGVDVSMTTLYSYENGNGRADPNIEAIAKVLGCTPRQLGRVPQLR